MYSQFLAGYLQQNHYPFLTLLKNALNSLLDTCPLTTHQPRSMCYMLSIPCWILAAGAPGGPSASRIYSQFLAGYLHVLPKPERLGEFLLSIPCWILAEGLYRCYIRFGGIYLYPPIELKYPILKNRVDQRT